MGNESVDRIEKAEVAGEQEVKTGPGGMDPPMEDYDGLNVRQATERLDSLSREELERVKSYEQEHKDRKTLIAELDKRLAAEEQQEPLVAEVDSGPADEKQQEGGMNGAWFSTYRNWILAAVGAAVLLWLIL